MPSLSTLVHSWSRYLDLTTDERLALRHGLPEEAALRLLKLKALPERARLLERATAESWTAAQMDRAVNDVLSRVDRVAGSEVARVNADVARKVRGMLSSSALAKLTPGAAVRLQEDLEALLSRHAAESVGERRMAGRANVAGDRD